MIVPKTKLKPTTAYLADDVYKELERLATKLDRSVSYVAAKFIREGLERRGLVEVLDEHQNDIEK